MYSDMKKQFSIAKGYSISNQFMARGLGTLTDKTISVEYIYFDSFIAKCFELKSKIDARKING